MTNNEKNKAPTKPEETKGTATAVPKAENQSVAVIESPSSKAQEVAQFRALNSATPIPEQQTADDSSPTQTPPAATSVPSNTP